MDRVEIKSQFTRKIISKFAKILVKNKTGYDVDFDLHKFETIIEDKGKMYVSINMDARLDRETYETVMKSIKIA